MAKACLNSTKGEVNCTRHGSEHTNTDHLPCSNPRGYAVGLREKAMLLCYELGSAGWTYCLAIQPRGSALSSGICSWGNTLQAGSKHTQSGKLHPLPSSLG